MPKTTTFDVSVFAILDLLLPFGRELEVRRVSVLPAPDDPAEPDRLRFTVVHDRSELPEGEASLQFREVQVVGGARVGVFDHARPVLLANEMCDERVPQGGPIDPLRLAGHVGDRGAEAIIPHHCTPRGRGRLIPLVDGDRIESGVIYEPDHHGIRKARLSGARELVRADGSRFTILETGEDDVTGKPWVRVAACNREPR